MYIPNKIRVGYQKRDNTYTGKLAYVVYYDDRDVLRKETSFQSWRDKEIEPNDYLNEPLSGFVLNKKAGDYQYGWNARKAYVRIYDPRGFEFEITIDNLVYILEHCNCEVGKGLDGEFVYGWDGKDLVLLPTNSKDYENFAHITKLKRTKSTITNTQLIVGATYLTKKNEELVYMCKSAEYGSFWSWNISQIPLNIDDIEEHSQKFVSTQVFWFYDIQNQRFETYKSINGKFVYCINQECVDDYELIYAKLNKNSKFSPVDLTNIELLPQEEFFINDDETYGYILRTNDYIKVDNNYVRYGQCSFAKKQNATHVEINNSQLAKHLENIGVEYIEEEQENNSYYRPHKITVTKYNIKDIFAKLEVYTPKYYLQSGYEYK